MSRDFTYIDDIIQGIIITLNNPPVKEKEQPLYQVFNIGNGSPVSLMEFIETLEENLWQVVEKILMGMQPGDGLRTWADTVHLNALGFQRTTSIQEGVKRFVELYREYSYH